MRFLLFAVKLFMCTIGSSFLLIDNIAHSTVVTDYLEGEGMPRMKARSHNFLI